MYNQYPDYYQQYQQPDPYQQPMMGPHGWPPPAPAPPLPYPSPFPQPSPFPYPQPAPWQSPMQMQPPPQMHHKDGDDDDDDDDEEDDDDDDDDPVRELALMRGLNYHEGGLDHNENEEVEEASKSSFWSFLLLLVLALAAGGIATYFILKNKPLKVNPQLQVDLITVDQSNVFTNADNRLNVIYKMTLKKLNSNNFTYTWSNTEIYLNDKQIGWSLALLPPYDTLTFEMKASYYLERNKFAEFRTNTSIAGRAVVRKLFSKPVLSNFSASVQCMISGNNNFQYRCPF